MPLNQYVAGLYYLFLIFSFFVCVKVQKISKLQYHLDKIMFEI